MGLSGIQYLSIIGSILAIYALYVEHMAHRATELGGSYSALCDIAGWFSCSKVFLSEYGKIMEQFVGEDSPLNLPNAAYGLLYYIAAFICPYFTFIPGRNFLMFLAATFSCGLSVYLGYVLYFILNDFCIVCVSTYVINFFIWVLSIKKLFTGDKPKGKKKKQ